MTTTRTKAASAKAAPDDDAPAPTDEKAKRPPAVVPSGEVRPQVGSPEDLDVTDAPVGDTPDGEALPTAEHFHTHGAGPELSPAGAHRHAGGDESHNHPLPPRQPDDVSIVPRPLDDSDGEDNDAVKVKVTRDCTAVVDGQVLTLKAGQVVEGAAGKFLADSGAPVTRA